MLNYSVTFNIVSAKVFSPAILVICFYNHKYIWIASTDYYMYSYLIWIASTDYYMYPYLIVLLPLTAKDKLINFIALSFLVY